MKKSKLTAKQKKFCKEYLIDLNATQACIRAGYSAKIANRQGAVNMSKDVIQEEIQRLQGNIEKKYDLRLENVLTNIEDLRTRSLDEGELNVSAKMIDMQMKHLGAYTQKVEVSGKDGDAIKHDVQVGVSPVLSAFIERLQADNNNEGE